jgi:hypothetical protein
MTSSSADRTAVMQPSQTIPATARVTVSDCGARLQDPERKLTLIVSSNVRLVIRSMVSLSACTLFWMDEESPGQIMPAPDAPSIP